MSVGSSPCGGDGGAGDCREGDADQNQDTILHDVLQSIWLEMARTQKTILAMILRMEKTSKCVRLLSEDTKGHSQRVKALANRFTAVEKKLDSWEKKIDVSPTDQETCEHRIDEDETGAEHRTDKELKTLERHLSLHDPLIQDTVTTFDSRGDVADESVQGVLESLNSQDEIEDLDVPIEEEVLMTNYLLPRESLSLPNFISDGSFALSSATSSSIESSFTDIHISPSCPILPVCRTASFIESTKPRHRSGRRRVLCRGRLKKTDEEGGKKIKRRPDTDDSSTSTSTSSAGADSPSSGSSSHIFRSASGSGRPISALLQSQDVVETLFKSLSKESSSSSISPSSYSFSVSSRSSSLFHTDHVSSRRDMSDDVNLQNVPNDKFPTIGRNRLNGDMKRRVNELLKSFSASTMRTSEASLNSSSTHLTDSSIYQTGYIIRTTQECAEHVKAQSKIMKELLHESVKKIQNSLKRNSGLEDFRSLSSHTENCIKKVRDHNVTDVDGGNTRNLGTCIYSTGCFLPVSSCSSLSSSSSSSIFSFLNSDIIFSPDSYALHPLVCRSESAMCSNQTSLSQVSLENKSLESHDCNIDIHRKLKGGSDTTVWTTGYCTDKEKHASDRNQKFEFYQPCGEEYDTNMKARKSVYSCVSSSSSLTCSTNLSSSDAVPLVVCYSVSDIHSTQSVVKGVLESEEDAETEDFWNELKNREMSNCLHPCSSTNDKKFIERNTPSENQMSTRKYEIMKASRESSSATDSTNCSFECDDIPSPVSQAVHPVPYSSKLAIGRTQTLPEKGNISEDPKVTKSNETSERISFSQPSHSGAISKSHVTPLSSLGAIHLGVSRSMSSISKSEVSRRELLGIKLLAALHDGRMTEFLDILKEISPTGEIPKISSSLVLSKKHISEYSQLKNRDIGENRSNYSSSVCSVASFESARVPSDTFVSNSLPNSTKTFPQSTPNRNVLGAKLLKASQEGKVTEVRQLLKRGANVNFANSWNWTPLLWASVKGHVKVVSVLLKNKADVNFRTNCGNTAMHMAACNRSSRCAKLLLNAGSGIDSWNHFGRTPLHLAAMGGNVEVVKTLVAAGASRTAKDNEGKAPFHVAKIDFLRRILHF